MFRPLLIAALTSVLCAATSANAVVYEIPLPGLQGVYGEASGISERITTIHLPGPATAIHGASLRVRGTAEVGKMLCGVPQVEYPWPTQVEGMMIQSFTPFRAWDAYRAMPDTPGPFEWTAPYVTSGPNPATWDFLLDGVGEARLIGGPSGILLGGCFTTTPSPNVTIEEATLFIDADIPVPAEGATWGRIKSTYR
jgi:hypothetical protein